MASLPAFGPRMALFVVLLVALTWGAQAKSPGQPPAVSAKAVYEHWCAPCHAPGPGHPGTQSLQFKYGGKLAAALLAGTALSPQAVSLFVRHGVLLMAPFRKTEITDAELSALAAYVAQNYKAP